MSIRVITNVKRVIKEIEDGNQNVIDGMRAGLFQGMRFFESHIQKTQMSNPATSPPKVFGVRRLTGTLARSWFTYVKKMYADFTVATATSTRYAIAHERPPGYTGTPYIPKRLHIATAFKRRGDEFIHEGMVKSLSRFVRIK